MDDAVQWNDRPTIYARYYSRFFASRCRSLYAQLSVSEISGSVGDLGTYIPLAVALARQDAIYLPSALFWAGVANVLTGFFWDVPMCVQPMKSIAAVAIAEGLSRHQVTAAGLWMGLFLILLSVTDGIEVVHWMVPTPVVSGIQMGVGVNLAMRGILLIQSLDWMMGDNDNDNGPDCILMAVVVAILCLYLQRERAEPQNNLTSIATEEEHTANQQSSSPSSTSSSTSSSSPMAPVGLYLFGWGMVLALVQLFTSSVGGRDSQPTSTNSLQWFGAPVITWALHDMSWEDWKQGLLQGAIPQLPLTTLNSVVSVCCLAHTLYPDKRRPSEPTSSTSTTANTAAVESSDAVISRKAVSLSVGMMNLVFCPLGAMPCCHGAGGLAGQHKFGARHGASVVFLGLNKMILATLLGGSLLVVLDALPVSILGLMLVVSGHELAMMGLTVLVQSSSAPDSAPTSTDGQDQNSTTSRAAAIDPLVLRKNSAIALVTVIVDVALHKTHYAALSGWITYMVYGDGVKDWRRQWHRRNTIVDGAGYSQVDQADNELDESGGLEASDP